MADWDILGKSFHLVLQATLNGVLQGGLYALIALGIVVINKASGIFNFAHGWMMFIGALIFWQFYDSPPSDTLLGVTVGLAAFLAVTVVFTLGITAPRPQADPPPKTKNRFVRVVHYWRGQQLVPQRALMFGGAGLVVWGLLVFLLTQSNWLVLRGAAAALIASVLIGLLVERITIRPLLGQPVLTAILMTLAIGFILQGVTQIVWGPNDHKLDVFKAEQPKASENSSKPPAATGTIVVPVFTFETGEAVTTETKQTVGTGSAPDYRLKTASWLGNDLRLKRFLVWGFGIAVATFVGFSLFFQYTSVGLALRATAENQVLAESVGLQVRLMLALSWAMVAVMATIAGVIQGTGGTGIAILVIPYLALRVFPAVLLGGLESITGAMVGGLVVGVVEQLTVVYIDTSAAQQMAPFVVLMIVLIIRPDGLFGQRRIDRV
ncbi:MAG: branched-chain amino acid ABC transporter permease [Anaerolineales bacterium]|nr:branched-chain amino acid ABC transporter permease [Anaerolineales bacterium]